MKQFAVIGVGNFGHYLATHLYEKGHDVLVIDKNPNRVQEIKDLVSQAVVADATDPKTMEGFDLEKMDGVIICIGSVLSNSILAALTMTELGVKNLYAKALSDSHGKILNRIGVTEVLFPEKDQAFTLAERLHNPNMIDYLPFIEGYSISKFIPPEEYMGKKLRELDMINRFGVQVIAVEETPMGKMNIIPTGTYTLKAGDILVVLGPDDALSDFAKPEEEEE